MADNTSTSRRLTKAEKKAVETLQSLALRVTDRRNMNARTAFLHDDEEVKRRAAARVTAYNLVLSEIGHLVAELSWP